MNTPLRRRAGGEGEEEMEWKKMRSSKRYPNFEIFEDLKSEMWNLFASQRENV